MQHRFAIDKLQCEAAGMHVLRGAMRTNEPMSKHTSWRVGGNVERYYRPVDLADLAELLQNLPLGEPLYLMGLGSNLLVRDGGLRGTVVAVHARLSTLRLIAQDESGGLVYAGAGVSCAKVARFAALHGLAGAEFLAGIPGTVGGAMAMNAGCYGTETWEIIERAQTIDQGGQLRVRKPKDYKVSYRQIALQLNSVDYSNEEWFVGGYFKLNSGNQLESRQKIKELLAQRVNSQPLNLPNAGSVFRNPPGDHAARLIESCGLKGSCIGGAMVSPKHANFIVNTGNAMAADIEALMVLMQAKVKQQTGTELIQEVRVIGDARSNA